ncbi:MAG: hypothetical protein EBZ95_04750 [Chitinophagia bacterium]|nr:hypothetical protein [Chitinophagia bacterium]
MKSIIYFSFLLLFPILSFAQKITYSEVQKGDSRDMSFDVIGKIKENVFIFKNARFKYALSVYNAEDMDLKEIVPLDFIPEKSFNVDYVLQSDNFYFIYQFQKKGVVYCMGAKMDLEGHLVGQPIELDTTQVGTFGENKIYSTINSEDKKQIMIFKILKRNDQFKFVTLLFDKNLLLTHKSRSAIPYDERKDELSDFSLDNEGNFVFTRSVKMGTRSNSSSLFLVKKPPLEDSFSEKKIDLKGLFVDEVKIKIDNLNKHYLFNAFYYLENRGNIDGIFCSVWDLKGDTTFSTVFTRLDASVRDIAKLKGNSKYALNDFFIRNVILKRDGSFLLAAEDYSTQTTGNNMGWNRWDYLYGSPFIGSYNSYYYNRSYGGFYRPYSSFNNSQTTRYYYNNILLLDINLSGNVVADKVITKDQFADDNDNYLSFSTFIAGSEIHFLYNLTEKRDKFLTDNTLTASGEMIRNPALRTVERGFEFMPKLSKQIGARQIIVPCSYRSQICFAKIEF